MKIFRKVILMIKLDVIASALYLSWVDIPHIYIFKEQLSKSNRYLLTLIQDEKDFAINNCFTRLLTSLTTFLRWAELCGVPRNQKNYLPIVIGRYRLLRFALCLPSRSVAHQYFYLVYCRRYSHKQHHQKYWPAVPKECIDEHNDRPKSKPNIQPDRVVERRPILFGRHCQQHGPRSGLQDGPQQQLDSEWETARLRFSSRLHQQSSLWNG